MSTISENILNTIFWILHYELSDPFSSRVDSAGASRDLVTRQWSHLPLIICSTYFVTDAISYNHVAVYDDDIMSMTMFQMLQSSLKQMWVRELHKYMYITFQKKKKIVASMRSK